MDTNKEKETCSCDIPIPTIKVSENGINAYCRICLKDYNSNKNYFLQ